jgi:hypothetical protein
MDGMEGKGFSNLKNKISAKSPKNLEKQKGLIKFT